MARRVGDLIACACAAGLLLAWQLARARPPAKRADIGADKGRNRNKGAAVTGPFSPEVMTASSPTAYATVPDLSDRADRAGVDLAPVPAVQRDETGRATPAQIVEQLALAGERKLENGAGCDAARLNEVSYSLTSEAPIGARGCDMPKAVSSFVELEDLAADVSGSVELLETAASTSEEGGPEPVSWMSVPMQGEGGDRTSKSDKVASADDSVARLDEFSREASDAPAAALLLQRLQADAAGVAETELQDASSPAKADLSAREADRDEIGSSPDPAVPAAPRRRNPRPVQHRDRRGQRRSTPGTTAAVKSSARVGPSETHRSPIEAKLRLELHPIRRTASLSAVLIRPDGFPDRIHVDLDLDGEQELAAYDETRYDDLLLTWSDALLANEIRLSSREGYQWLRSARRVHLFQELPEEVGLISTGAAKAGHHYAVVCASSDEGAVRAAAEACGSPLLTASDGWSGVPAGWVVLSNYRPVHAPAEPLLFGLTSMNPGLATEIRLAGGLLLRSGLYAAGHQPRIEIDPLPLGARVTIDGLPAERDTAGWIAEGWSNPGQHLVDVVPGPSATYRILEDPWSAGGWELWEAHPGRFDADGNGPWQHVEICGARLSAAGGQHVVAAPTSASVILLGLARGVIALRPRDGVPVAIALASETPAFLISSLGPRRAQGRVEWLSPLPTSTRGRGIDATWIAAVRSAAARRLPVDSVSAAASRAWQAARERARRYRRWGRD